MQVVLKLDEVATIRGDVGVLMLQMFAGIPLTLSRQTCVAVMQVI